MIPVLRLVGLLALVYILFRRPTQEVIVTSPVATTIAAPTPTERTYEIVTLLPPDAIPSIDNPVFLTAEEADEEYAPQEMVLGVSIDGDHRAYSSSHLDSHEIVNDTVGGRPIAVTW